MTKKVLLIFGLLFAIGAVIVVVRLRSLEDTWICKDGVWVKHGNPSGPMPTGSCKEGEKTNSKAGQEATLPNPASQNCIEKGGQLVMLQETAGTLGICKFSDGSECEEWQFYRGECQKGQYAKADTFHPYKGKLSLSKSTYFLDDENGNRYTVQLPANISKELKERLAEEVLGKEMVTILASETPPLSKVLVLKSFVEK